MMVAPRLAWRTARGSWRHAAGVVACVVLGVAALVAVGSFGSSLGRTLDREGKILMGGDLDIRSSRPLPAGVEAVLAEAGTRGAVSTRVLELVAMARDPRNGGSLLAELKAVGPGYPLYGRMEAHPDLPLDALLRDGGAVVESALLQRLGLRVGDPVLVGAARLAVRGVVVREPDRMTGLVTLGPRILVNAETLERTGLVQPGSRVRYRTLVRLPLPLSARAARDDLARALDDPAVRVVTWDEARPGLRRFFDQLTTYLGLVGLVSLLVGSIGVASAVRVLMIRARPTLAVLKCLGASSRTLLVTYLTQTLALGLLGSLGGAALGAAIQPVVARLLAGLLPVRVVAEPDGGAIVRGIAMGLLTTLLVALWPLLEIRVIPPSLLLRQEVEPSRRRAPWPVPLALGTGLAVLAVWQAGSLGVGAIFVGGAAGALLLLALTGVGMTRLARRLPRLPSLAWRQGLANLHRPGGQGVGVIVALGVGVMLLVAVGWLQAGIDRQIDLENRRQAPSFFFLDLQADQTAAFVRTVAELTGGTRPDLTAIVRARLAAVNGEAVTRESIERRRAAGHQALWYFTRDYALTSARELPSGNVLLRGRWWTGEGARPRVSVEEDAARHLGVGVGSTLAFDIQGLPVEAEVESIRRVDWESLGINFFVLFSPGVLDGAPTTYVATVRVPAPLETPLQDAVSAVFPNVTAIPVRDVLERVAALLGQIAVAIRVIALFTVGAGLAVMVGALAASRYQRLTESVILRTLGATRGVVARIFAVEYACLGAAAGLGGSLLAVLLAWAVLRLVLDVPWTFEPGLLVLGVGLATVLALAVGGLSTWRLLGEKPFPVLRRE